MRIISSIQRPLARTHDVDGGLPRPCGRMRCQVGRLDRELRNRGQDTSGELERCARRSHRIGERCARDLSDLDGLTQLIVRDRELRLGTRLIGAGPELVLHQRADIVREDLEPIDVRASRTNGFVRGEHGQERIGGGRRDIEFGER